MNTSNTNQWINDVIEAYKAGNFDETPPLPMPAPEWAQKSVTKLGSFPEVAVEHTAQVTAGPIDLMIEQLVTIFADDVTDMNGKHWKKGEVDITPPVFVITTGLESVELTEFSPGMLRNVSGGLYQLAAILETEDRPSTEAYDQHEPEQCQQFPWCDIDHSDPTEEPLHSPDVWHRTPLSTEESPGTLRVDAILHGGHAALSIVDSVDWSVAGSDATAFFAEVRAWVDDIENRFAEFKQSTRELHRHTEPGEPDLAGRGGGL